MKKTILLVATLLLTVGAASAQTTQEWTTGWDNFGEPVDLTHSNVKWSLAAGSSSDPPQQASYLIFMLIDI